MFRSLWTGQSGMATQQTNIDVISNNLANINTTGFKKSRAEFSDLLYQSIKTPGSSSTTNTTLPTGIQIGHGARTTAVHKMFLQGNFKTSDNPLDMAIGGSGFFKVTLPDGNVGYTRDGSFSLDKDGSIVNSSGYKLDPEITIPQDAMNITVGSDGTVSVMQQGQTAPNVVGNIEISNFVNPAGLNSMGSNLYLETESSGTPIAGTPGLDGLGEIRQNFLEMSNVDIAEEMVNLIVAQRAYESNSKTIKSADDMLGMANALKR